MRERKRKRERETEKRAFEMLLEWRMNIEFASVRWMSRLLSQIQLHGIHITHTYIYTHRAYYSNWVLWVWDCRKWCRVDTIPNNSYLYSTFNYISLCWCDKLLLLIEVFLCYFPREKNERKFQRNFISVV